MTTGESIVNDLINANNRLKEVLSMEPSDINQDATIQRFEFTFELSWKLMQIILNDNGRPTRGIKDVFRQAIDFRLIDNFKTWSGFLDDRNLTVHTYKLETARTIYNHLNDFPTEVDKLLKKSKELL